ncbi:glycosyltransferase family 4 protein [uncultured Christiangramia sp.]|uniref:glycosyltransferase family 4 protein n=1 Tax=uncultured Christiangramia sp. TaxID=503836 RepID=UPI002614146B|nr:MraY family glycosyltransferase [uncultured Christiangramia sp.]
MNILDQQVLLEYFRHYYLFFTAAVFAGAFMLTFYLIPKVLWVSKEKNLMAAVNNRSAHTQAVPTFGGVAFYITMILFLALLQSMRLSYVGSHLIAAISILFMVGLKDDLVVSTARVKLFGQIAASFFIIFSPELHLESLYGFMGMHEIPLLVGYIINTVIAIAIINAYNLIDGIDGLASLVGIVISLVYAWVFYGTGDPFYVLVSVSTAGILAAFLRFNYSRGTRKIFMGDSGSLMIGLILAFLTIKLLTMPISLPFLEQGYSPANRLLFIACVLFIPVFDTLRVMIIRMIRGASPFSPDRNHAHHVIIDLGLSHRRAGVFLALLNFLVILVYTYFSSRLSHLWLVFLVVSIYASSFALFHFLKNNVRSAAQRSHSERVMEG